MLGSFYEKMASKLQHKQTGFPAQSVKNKKQKITSKMNEGANTIKPNTNRM